MPSAASAHPLWGAVLRSLREMTRLAVAVLALSTGLGTAVSSAPPPAAHTTATVHVDAASPISAPAPPQHATGAVTVVTAPQPGSPLVEAAAAPAIREVVTGVPLVAGVVVEPLRDPVGGVVAPADPGAVPVEPVPDAATRRGPPSA